MNTTDTNEQPVEALPAILKLWICCRCGSPRLYGSSNECKTCGMLLHDTGEYALVSGVNAADKLPNRIYVPASGAQLMAVSPELQNVEGAWYVLESSRSVSAATGDESVAFTAYNQAVEDALTAIRGESQGGGYWAATYINAIARRCSPFWYVAAQFTTPTYDQVVQAITDIREARESHTQWAAHLRDANREDCKGCHDHAAHIGDAAYHDEWIAKYDNVIYVLAHAPWNSNSPEDETADVRAEHRIAVRFLSKMGYERCGHCDSWHEKSRKGESQCPTRPERKRPYCQHCKGKGWFDGLEIPCRWCNPGGEFRSLGLGPSPAAASEGEQE